MADDPTPRLVSLGTLFDSFLAEASERYDARKAGRKLGPGTGFDSLDRDLSGRLAPGVHFLHGNAGAGKTAFLWQMAARCGCPSVFISCELGPMELAARAISRETGEYLGRLKGGELAPGRIQELARKTAEQCRHVYLIDATRAWPDPAFLAEHIAIARGDSPHVLVCLDSVHTWAQALPGELSEYDTLGAAIDALRKLAATVNAPIIGIAERNRASMGSGGLNASAGNRKFEYAAESVIDLSIVDPEGENGAGRGRGKPSDTPRGEVMPVRVTLSKNRHGSAGKTLNLQFEGRIQQFTDPAAFGAEPVRAWY